MNKTYSLSFFLLIAFIEGGAVMSCEMLSARLIAPFYGTTLFVWSTVIGVTLAALAMGYFFGGYLSNHFAKPETLFKVLAIGAVLIALMPILGRFILDLTAPLGVRLGSLVSALVFLLPPLAFLGTTSPIIIRLASPSVEQAGRTAGTVYSVSTISGILSTFFMGFYAIPAFGISIPCYLTAVFLALPSLWYFLKGRQIKAITVLLLGFGLSAFTLFSNNRPTTHGKFTLRYHAEGLLGQLLVVDIVEPTDSVFKDRRMLMINQQAQTMADAKTSISLFPYAHAMSLAASVKPVGSKALLLGLGGGSMADEFLRLGFDVTAVELDERIADVAHNYFNLSDKCKVIVDDARHFLNNCTTPQYDIVVFDAFNGENIPAHLLTQESLAQVHRILKPDGLMLLNFTGFITGEEGMAARSVLKTLLHSGFEVQMLPTPGKESERNILFFASKTKQDFGLINAERANACCTKRMHTPIPLPLHPSESVNITDAYLLTDDRPLLDFLHILSGEAWRTGILENKDSEDIKALLGY